jgi:hypothetical protein
MRSVVFSVYFVLKMLDAHKPSKFQHVLSEYDKVTRNLTTKLCPFKIINQRKDLKMQIKLKTA